MISNSPKKILIIGAGNMGRALARGLQNSASENFFLSGYDVNEDRLQVLHRETGAKMVKDIAKVSLHEHILLICTKPHNLPAVADQLQPSLRPNTMIISILAGTTITELAREFVNCHAIVRCMPNIGATVGSSATALSQNGNLSKVQSETVENIFNSVGQCWWLPESLLDAVTGLSGSGPAYLYMVIEALTDGGVKMGLPRNLSAAMAAQTVLGAARLVQESGLHPAVLRDQVTTPGGTTITAIHELEERGLRAMLMRAVELAAKHSEKLGARPLPLAAPAKKAS